MDTDCYAEGFNAFYEGKGCFDCPYDYRAPERETWVLGWEAAEDAAYNKAYP